MGGYYGEAGGEVSRQATKTRRREIRITHGSLAPRFDRGARLPLVEGTGAVGEGRLKARDRRRVAVWVEAGRRAYGKTPLRGPRGEGTGEVGKGRLRARDRRRVAVWV